MTYQKPNKIVFLLLSFLLLFSNLLFGLGTTQANTYEKNDLKTQRKTQNLKVDMSQFDNPKEKVRVIVELEGAPAIEYATKQGVMFKDLTQSKKTQLQSTVKNQQTDFLSTVKKKKISFKVENTFTTVSNGVSGEMQAKDIPNLEKLPNVSAVYIANEYERPKVKPEMISSGDIVEASQTWVKGYNGTGTVVGVVDTGIDPDHKDMTLSDESKGKLSKKDVASFVDKNHLDGKYYTAKVPYGYNYYDKNSEIRDLGPDASMHGMHVGGTVGANGNDDGIKGIAPETQLLALKVFGNDAAMPSTWGDIYIKAIDDAILLGADVINMSLGSTGEFQDPNDPEQMAIERAVNNGVLMAISAGNSAQFSDGYADPLAENPDIGVVGSPSVSKDSVSVASVENTHIMLDEFNFTIGEETYTAGYKTQSSPIPYEVFGSEQQDVVYVGNGAPEQYEGKNVSGKVVFAVRTAANPNYGEIQKNAEAAGAAGVIIRGTPAHGDYVSMALNNPTIPLLSLSVSDGTKFEDKIKKANDVGKVVFTGKQTKVPNTTAGKMSDFTSWGVTPNLDFKPEITAPGGKIYSTLNNDKYGVMSGTSMAAPHVAGGSALILQYVKQTFPNLSGKAKVKRAKTILLNTSEPLKDPDGTTYYSPRRQGSGVMKLNSAITSPIYIVQKGTDEGKVALKEISKNTFSFTLTATNFSDKNATYKVDTSVLTDTIVKNSGYDFNGLTPQEIKNATVKADKEVTIPARKSKDITITVDLSKANTELEKIMKNGYFVEGFVFLKAKNIEDSLPTLSVPFVGFKGDWNKANIIDPLSYEDNTYYGITGLAYDDGKNISHYGDNPFTAVTDVDPAKVGFSPNGDKVNDVVTPIVSFLRNSKTVEYSIVDKNGKILRTLFNDKNQIKNYYEDSDFTYKAHYTTWDGKINNKPAAEGQYFYQIKTQIDYPNKPQQTVKIPVIVDITAPAVSKVKYDDKTKILTFNASDNSEGTGLQYIKLTVDGKPVDLVEPKAQKEHSIEVKDLKFADKDKTPVTVQKGADIKVEVVDYAGNSSYQTLLDQKVPDIVTSSPEALGLFDKKEVPVKGYITDDSAIDYLKITGDTMEPKEKNLSLVWDEKDKRYNFEDKLSFKKDGIHDIYFQSEDIVGNKSEFNRQIIVDTTDPTIEIKGLPKSGYSNKATQKVSVTVADNFDSLRLLVNGNEEINTAVDMGDIPKFGTFKKSKDITLNLSKGKNEFVFEVEDLLGHKVTKEITIQRENGPAKPTVKTVSDATLKITGTATSGSTVMITDKKKLNLSAKVATNGTFSVSLKNKLKAGTKLYVTAKDTKKELISSETVITVADKTAPGAPSVNSVSDKSTSVTGKTEAGAKVTIKAGKKTLGTATANSKGSYTVKISKQKASTTLSVTAKDKAGNTSKAKTVKVSDKTAPAAPTVNKVKASTTKVTGKTEAGAKVTVKAGKKTLGTATANSKGSYSVKIKKQKSGTQLSVTAKDKAGNTSKARTIKVQK